MKLRKEVSVNLRITHRTGANINVTEIAEEGDTEAKTVLAAKLKWLNRYCGGKYYDLPSARKACGGIKIKGDIL